MQKQMPPRYWARCSTASRSRRGPEGPSISQFGPWRKVFVGQRLAEQRVVGAKIVDRDAALGNARRAAGFEHVDRLVGERLGHPAPHRPAAQPFVFERLELFQVVERADFLERIEFQRLGIFEPERAAGRRMKVPLHGFVAYGRPARSRARLTADSKSATEACSSVLMKTPEKVGYASTASRLARWAFGEARPKH